MNGDQAILDRATRHEAPAETSEPGASAASRRGSWLQWLAIQHFEWNRHDLRVASLPPALDGVRILHLSDIHLQSTWHPALDELHQRIARDVFDLIFITGDFVEDKLDARDAAPMVERFVRGLRCRFGIYAVMGNHDGDFLGPRVARLGVKVLPIGSPTTITVRGEPIELLGLAGLDRHDLRMQHVLDIPPTRSRDPRIPRIVLSHYPDALVMLQNHDVVPPLFFAGHTHGGQVCLPGGFPILRHDTLPRRFCSGVHRLGQTWLIVTRGMGFSSYPIRLFCPAEVVEVVMRADENSGQPPAVSYQPENATAVWLTADR